MTIKVYGITPDNVSKEFDAYAGIYFPTIWNWTNLEIAPNQNIVWTTRVCLDFDCNYPIQGANLSVIEVYSDTWYSSSVLSASSWNSTNTTTNSNGYAVLSISPNATNWTIGSTLRTRYKIIYQNATTIGERNSIRVKQKVLGSWGGMLNYSNTTISNATIGKSFWVEIYVSNNENADANSTSVSITQPVGSTNSSSTIANLTPLTAATRNILVSNTNSTRWLFNTSNAGNYTTTVTITPPSGFVGSSFTYSFGVGVG